MKALRVLVVLLVLSFGPVFANNASAQWGWGYSCTAFWGNCPNACDMYGHYMGYSWPSACGDSCVCRHWAITVYTWLGDNECTLICDYGHDDYCDCSGWALDPGVGIPREFLI